MSKVSRSYYNKILEQAKNNANGQTTTGTQKEFLKWIYSGGIVDLKGSKIRILPQKNKTNSFFFIYNIHQYKIGKLSKMCTCLNSQDRDGNTWGTCPICDFISNNKLDKDVWKKFVKKQSNVMLAYNYEDEKIYLTTVFMNILLDNIIPKISELDEEDLEKVDANGFDLVFKREDGFPVFRKINIDVPELEELGLMGLNIDTIPKIDMEVKPSAKSDKFLAHIYNMLEVGVNAYCPDLSDQLEKYREEFKPIVEDDNIDGSDEDTTSSKSKTSKKMVDDDESEDEKPVQKSVTSSKKKVKEPEPEDDDTDNTEEDDSDWDDLISELND
jgi:hypothetical protein